MRQRSPEETSEHSQLPRAKKKARLFTAVLTLLSSFGVKTEQQQPKLEARTAPAAPEVRADQREEPSFGGLTVTSSGNPDSERSDAVTNALRNAEAILQPTLTLETDDIETLHLQIEDILAQIRRGELEVSVVHVTNNSGNVIYGVSANPGSDEQPFAFAGHAYALHEGHFSYDLSEKYNLGPDFVVTTLQPMDASTGRVSDEQEMTTLVRSGDLVLPEGCDTANWPQACAASIIESWIAHELNNATVGVQYFYGH